jgi:hypothetical protein
MSSNTEILQYVNRYFRKNIQLEDQIETLFNNLSSDKCYILYNNVTDYIINGVSVFSPRLIDLCLIIPNLFRLCFFNESGIKIPNICPRFIYSSTITYYYPKLIDENQIKFFLYYNFPSNIYDYSGKDAIAQLAINKQLLVEKKKNNTVGSFSTPNELFNQIYSNNSLIVQLLQFNNYVIQCNNKVSLNEVFGNFRILWDYTGYCISYTEYISDTYIVSDTNKNNLVTQPMGNNLFLIKNGLLKRFTNAELEIFKNIKTIYTVLNYALEVYQDILLELQYFINDLEYCHQSYMNINNINPMLQMYNIYYKNEDYVKSKNLTQNLSNNIQASVIDINVYISKFENIYAETYPNIYLLKNVILNNSSGLVFYSTVVSTSTNISSNNYIYYYINIFDPSPILVKNIWTINKNYSVSGINLFIKDFINGVTFGSVVWKGYLTISGSTGFRATPYKGGGLYPNQGSNYNNINNIGYLYRFVNNKTFNSSVYLTLETIKISGTEYAYGVALILEKNY